VPARERGRLEKLEKVHATQQKKKRKPGHQNVMRTHSYGHTRLKKRPRLWSNIAFWTEDFQLPRRKPRKATVMRGKKGIEGYLDSKKGHTVQGRFWEEGQRGTAGKLPGPSDGA